MPVRPNDNQYQTVVDYDNAQVYYDAQTSAQATSDWVISSAYAGSPSSTAVSVSLVLSIVESKIEEMLEKQAKRMYQIVSEHCGFDIDEEEFLKLLKEG